MFEEFVKRFRDPLISDLRGYLRWMRGMSILKTFLVFGLEESRILGLDGFRQTDRRLESFEDEGHVNQFKHGLKPLP